MPDIVANDLNGQFIAYAKQWRPITDDTNLSSYPWSLFIVSRVQLPLCDLGLAFGLAVSSVSSDSGADGGYQYQAADKKLSSPLYLLCGSLLIIFGVIIIFIEMEKGSLFTLVGIVLLFVGLCIDFG